MHIYFARRSVEDSARWVVCRRDRGMWLDGVWHPEVVQVGLLDAKEALRCISSLCSSRVTAV